VVDNMWNFVLLAKLWSIICGTSFCRQNCGR
jgi:hypothetical protein